MASRTVSIVLTGTNASAVKAIAGVETAAAKAGAGASGHMEKSAGKIGVAFHALDQQLSAFGVPFAGTFGLVGATLEHAENKTKSFGSTLSKVGQIELTAAVIGIAAIGSEAVHLADDLEQAHAREETAIKNTGGAYEEYASRIRATDSQMEKFGFTNAETESSLANLTNATHDAGKAIDLQGLAADIARGRHIGLTEATSILMKVETGHVALLGRLGINIKDASGKVISQEEAIRRLSATYKGQAAAAADTFAGKMKTLSTTVQDVGAKLGENIVPKVEAVASAISGGVSSFEEFNASLDGVPGKVLAVGAAFPAIFFAGGKIVDGLKGIGTAVGDAVGRLGRFTGVTAEVAGAEDAATAALDSNTAATATNSSAKVTRVLLTEDEVVAANASAAATLDQEAAYAGLTGTLDSATIATHALTQADLDQIAVFAALTGEEEAAVLGTKALTVAEEELAVSTGALSAVFGTVGGALTALTGGFLVGKLAGDKLNDMLGGTKPNVQELTDSLGKLAKTGQISGALSADFGPSLEKLAADVDKVNGGVHLFGNISWASPSARQAKKDFDALNESLENILKTQGVSAAGSAFQSVRDQLKALGVPLETIYELLNPFLHRLGGELPTAAHAAGASIADLRAEFAAFATSLDKVDAGLKIADSFDAIGSAADKVAADKADLAGTSKTAIDANRGEAAAVQGLSNSYEGLRNAQDGVSTAAHTLLEAQRALDQYNSPRGVKERSLQLDIIQRRVVNTPAESDQKQLDLLQFDDTNAQKKQQLQDAVIAGQKGLADAERGVVTATRAVSDAQQTVADAVARRKAVHDDAAKAIAGDERKVQEAVINTVQLIGTAASKQQVANDQLKTWVGLLDAVTKIYAPGSDLAKNIDAFYQKIITDQDAANKGAQGPSSGASAFFSQFKGSGVGVLSGPTLDRLLLEATGKFVGPISPGDKKLLHQLGVPGFAKGGIAEKHVAQIAAPAARIWAEPETGGEAYIPLAPSKRSRSRDILATVAEKFGLRLTGSPTLPANTPPGDEKVKRLAEGGITSPTVAIASVASPQRSPNVAKKVAGSTVPAQHVNAPAAAQDAVMRRSATRRVGSASAVPSEPVSASGEKVAAQYKSESTFSPSTFAHFTAGGLADGGPAAAAPHKPVAHGEKSPTPAEQTSGPSRLVEKYSDKVRERIVEQVSAVERVVSSIKHLATVSNEKTVERYAAGGVTEKHVAQIASAGKRVWAEPETGGEAYIPLASTKRSRSTGILATVAEKFGFHLKDANDKKILFADRVPIERQTSPARPAGSRAPKPVPFASGGIVSRDRDERHVQAKVQPEGRTRTPQRVVPQAVSPPAAAYVAARQPVVRPTVAHSGLTSDIAAPKIQAAPAPQATSARITTPRLRADSLLQRVEAKSVASSATSHFSERNSSTVQSLVSHHTSATEKTAVPVIPNVKVPVTPARASLPRPTVLPVRPLTTTTTVQHIIDARTTNNFHGAQTPTLAELDYLNREQGWKLARTGRS